MKHMTTGSGWLLAMVALLAGVIPRASAIIDAPVRTTSIDCVTVVDHEGRKLERVDMRLPKEGRWELSSAEWGSRFLTGAAFIFHDAESGEDAFGTTHAHNGIMRPWEPEIRYAHTMRGALVPFGRRIGWGMGASSFSDERYISESRITLFDEGTLQIAWTPHLADDCPGEVAVVAKKDVSGSLSQNRTVMRWASSSRFLFAFHPDWGCAVARYEGGERLGTIAQGTKRGRWAEMPPEKGYEHRASFPPHFIDDRTLLMANGGRLFTWDLISGAHRDLFESKDAITEMLVAEKYIDRETTLKRIALQAGRKATIIGADGNSIVSPFPLTSEKEKMIGFGEHVVTESDGEIREYKRELFDSVPIYRLASTPRALEFRHLGRGYLLATYSDRIELIDLKDRVIFDSLTPPPGEDWSASLHAHLTSTPSIVTLSIQGRNVRIHLWKVDR